MFKDKSHFTSPVIIILAGLIVRFIVVNNLYGLESSFNQPLVLQLLSFSLPISLFVYLFVSFLNGILFYLLGKQKNTFTGILAASIYSFSPWFIYTDISYSVYTLGLFAVLLTIYGFLNKNTLKGYRLFLGGGILFSYLFLFGFIYYLFLLVIAFRKERSRLFSGLVPLVPLLCLFFYNIEGVRNILKMELSLFNDIGNINAINTFQGNLYESEWGSFGKIILNKLSYFFLVLIDSFLTILSPVTYFSAERKMFGFSNLAPLSFVLLIPLLPAFKSVVFNRRKIVWLVGVLLLAVSAIFSSKNMQLEKLILISPFIILPISLGINELKVKKYKLILMGITLVFIAGLFINAIDFSMYEKIRMDLFIK